MGTGGEREDETWADFRAERDSRLQLQGGGARPCLLERRDGLTRGVRNRLALNGRFPDLAL